MRNPLRRTPPRDPQVEQALRHSLAEHARQAPAGDRVADRVLAAVGRGQPAPDRDEGPARWRTWTLPLVAAGSVAAIVGAVVGIQQLDEPTHRNSAVASPTVRESVPQTFAPTTPIPTTSAPPVHTSTAPVDTSTLHGVDILDLTFAGEDDGWALASADCINGSGRCPAVLRTHDGTQWDSANLVDFNVPGQTGGCTYPCVEHLRFGTDDIGYAFGPHALLMTTDGGRHWSRESGGALFLETFNQNVIRVTSSGPGCPGPCDLRVQTAGLGSSTWTTQLGPVNTAGGVDFARGGDDAYLLLTGHVAGGGSSATSTLYRSGDNGATWTQGGEPCPQSGEEVDSYTIAAGADGRAAVLCRPRASSVDGWVATSSDHGAHFAAQPGRIPHLGLRQLAGDPATVLIAAGTAVARSADGGQSWARVNPIEYVSFVGFESTHVGRIVAERPVSRNPNAPTPEGGRSEIWTTRDGGKSWTKVRFR